MKLQGLILDIDGTLVDTNDLHAECWLEAHGPLAARRPLVQYYTQLLEVGLRFASMCEELGRKIDRIDAYFND